jgi:protocatechuate 3,4-dioxygenase beta subunit
VEGEEGPYYVDAAKLRTDLTENRPGLPLRLRIAVVNSKTCAPLENAAVDIWHCDAMGTYSGFTSQGSGGPAGFGGGRRGPGGPGGPGGPRQIDETRFLRGIQLTGKQGLVEFASVYPGWYQGRTIHIHMKVHLGGPANETYQGGHVSHTGQLYFPEDVTAEIARMQPYEANSGVHRTLHTEDGIYKSQHGELSLVTLDRPQAGKNEGGSPWTPTPPLRP